MFAEICTAVRLGQKGAVDFEPLKPAGNQETPDFICQFGGKRTAVEVKNLRVHRFPEKVMLDHYLDIALKRGISHPLTLILHKSTRESLGRTERGESDQHAGEAVHSETPKRVKPGCGFRGMAISVPK